MLAQAGDQGVLPLLSISVGPKHTQKCRHTCIHTHTLFHYFFARRRVFLLTLRLCFVSSHRLVLLPRPLEVQAAVLSALDDRPPATGTLHVAVHLHNRRGKMTSGEGMGLLWSETNKSLKTREDGAMRFNDPV